MSSLSFNTTKQPTSGFFGTNPLTSKTSSSFVFPSSSAQSSGVNNSNPAISSTPQNGGLIPNSTPSPNTHTITTKTGGGSTAKPTPNPSVHEQQKSLNLQNKNTPGYIPLIEDGLAGPKTSAALQQYGYNPQTGAKNTPDATTNSSSSTGNTDNTQNTTPNQSNIIQGLVGQSQGPTQAYTDAQNNANKINQQIEDAKAQMAKQTSDINQSGTWTSRALGEQGQANIQNSATLAALGSQYQGAQQQLSAANTQQGLQVQAGTNAATVNAPQLGQYGQTYYQPGQAGQNSGSGGVSPNDPFYATLQNYAQMAANGQISSVPSSITGNAVLNNQMNQMAKKINPSYNPINSQAMGDILSKLPALKTAATSLYSVFDSVVSTFNNMPQAFKSDSRWMNAKLSDLTNFTGAGSTQVQAFASAVNEARIQLSQTINSAVNAGVDMGGQTATSLLPNNMTPGQVATQLDLARKFVNARISASASAGSNYNPNLSGGNSGGGNNWNDIFVRA